MSAYGATSSRRVTHFQAPGPLTASPAEKWRPSVETSSPPETRAAPSQVSTLAALSPSVISSVTCDGGAGTACGLAAPRKKNPPATHTAAAAANTDVFLMTAVQYK